MDRQEVQTTGLDLAEYLVGGGAIERRGARLALITRAATAQQYSDAQLDDYHALPRRRFRWRPPLRLTVRARFSHPAGALRGTAGFGFWNDPFMMTGARLPSLPRAVWFFYASPPSDMALATGVPGHGWKAAAIDAWRPRALLLAPLAPPALLLVRRPSLYQRLWPGIQRALAVSETLLTMDMTAWHDYALDWGIERAEFSVDGTPVLCAAPSPGGRLGFVMWLDNQYMVATPQGRFGWGLLDAPGEQWLEVERLEITQAPA
jgi:hypothetical protein